MKPDFSVYSLTNTKRSRFTCYKDWNTCFTYKEIPNLNIMTTTPSWGGNTCKWQMVKKCTQIQSFLIYFNKEETRHMCFVLNGSNSMYLWNFIKKMWNKAHFWVVGKENRRMGCVFFWQSNSLKLLIMT